jgi:AraC-like DNA-binding protein
LKVYRAKDRIKDGLSLEIFFNKNILSTKEHKHDFLEIVYVKSGRVKELVNGTEYEMGRGQLLFINYDSVHAFSGSDDFSFYNICFAPDVLAGCVISKDNAFDLLSLSAFEELKSPYSEGVITFSGKERIWIETVLSDMLEEYTAKNTDMRSVLESYMILLITKILRKTRLVLKNSDTRQDIFSDLANYISDNLDKKLTLGELARKCFYNPSYFSRVFKERFNMTFQDYVNRERASVAAQLLSETPATVEEISEMCGYGDKSSLNRAFLRFFGCTPTEYRKRMKKY